VAATTDGVWLVTASSTGTYPTTVYRGELWERLGKGAWTKAYDLERERFSDITTSKDGTRVLAVGGSSTVGHEGWIALVRTGGEWQEKRGFGIGSRPMNAVAYDHDGRWWAVGASQAWIDGGRRHPPEACCSAVAPLAGGVGWLGSGNLIWRYRNAEDLWELIVDSDGEALNDMVAPSPELALAVGDGGRLMIWRRAVPPYAPPVYLPFASLQSTGPMP
jgi:hypothetical protein